MRQQNASKIENKFLQECSKTCLDVWRRDMSNPQERGKNTRENGGESVEMDCGNTFDGEKTRRYGGCRWMENTAMNGKC